MHKRKIFVLSLLILLALCSVAPAQRKVLCETSSEFNEQIIVTEDAAGVRTLWFELDGAMQSVVKVGDPDYIALPYAQAMTVAMAVAEEPERVLIVGLGGATIPNFLHKHYPKLKIDVVDIDPVVVEVAKKYFAFKEDENLKVHVADGRKFIEESPGRYDIIFLDAFGAHNIPYALATQEFLRLVEKALTPKGMVAGNVWSGYWNPLYNSMVRTYITVFEEVYVMDVENTGNRIVIAVPRDGEIKREELAERAAKVAKDGEYPFDLAAMVTYGFRFPLGELTAGDVLRDRDQEEETAEDEGAAEEDAEADKAAAEEDAEKDKAAAEEDAEAEQAEEAAAA